MEKRITIKGDDYSLVGTESEKGITLQLSPYDIPSEVRAELKDGIVHIYFQYVDQEQEAAKTVNDQIKMKVGKYSGKILGLEIDVKSRDIHQVAVKVDNIVANEARHAKRYNQRANYEFVKEILARNWEPLFAGA